MREEGSKRVTKVTALKQDGGGGRGEDNPHRPEGGAMAYYKVRIEVWCDWNPAESDLEEIAFPLNGNAIP